MIIITSFFKDFHNSYFSIIIVIYFKILCRNQRLFIQGSSVKTVNFLMNFPVHYDSSNAYKGFWELFTVIFPHTIVTMYSTNNYYNYYYIRVIIILIMLTTLSLYNQVPFTNMYKLTLECVWARYFIKMNSGIHFFFLGTNYIFIIIIIITIFNI